MMYNCEDLKSDENDPEEFSAKTTLSDSPEPSHSSHYLTEHVKTPREEDLDVMSTHASPTTIRHERRHVCNYSRDDLASFRQSLRH